MAPLGARVALLISLPLPSTPRCAGSAREWTHGPKGQHARDMMAVGLSQRGCVVPLKFLLSLRQAQASSVQTATGRK